MSFLCIFKCGDIQFDVWDRERIPANEKKSDYYVTPQKLASIEKWMIENFIQKISNKEQLDYLISNNLIARY